MIKEQYVNKDTAALLKEKGFNWRVNSYYTKQDNIFRSSDTLYTNWNETAAISRPTQQMAIRWLREEHNVHINLLPYDIEPRESGSIVRYLPEIYTLPAKGHELDVTGMNACNSYEEACEAAIKYSLTTLIK